uniref:NADH dehydrogenase subunit 6 n=1 Tax=Rexea antefurcata TaxID=887133 RepID=UPI002200DE31|nr:NADH dehydrogenase subunit 6 [Rexea antefurcata]UXX50404.1 NADH dehydrogenase subunit 6 [Rexea antefurcata]
MTYLMCLFLCGFVLGVVGVASNPAPYFAALGLVAVSAMGCAILAQYGGPFLSLVLFLIYLGGMLVVFAFTSALAADRDPKTWGDFFVGAAAGSYMLMVLLCCLYVYGGWYEASWVPSDDMEYFALFRSDSNGVALMYSLGAGMLVIGAWVLLLTLFVVLELTRGLSRGAVRAV